MKQITVKKIRASLLIGLVFTIIMSTVSFEANCEQLRNNVLRLHIRANSDSDADQALKLAVRDEILATTGVEFESCTNLEQAESFVKANIESIKAAADGVIKEKGYAYKCNVTLDKAYFETREYETFTLPAGYYDAVIIEIGEGKGKNWWCVMFPSLCVGASKSRLSTVVDKDADKIATNPQNYQIRFKTVEIYEYLKKLF